MICTEAGKNSVLNCSVILFR